MNKKISIAFLLLFLAISICLNAQNEMQRPLVNNTWQIGITNLKLYDSGLSELEYSGQGYFLQDEYSAFFRRSGNRLSWLNQTNVTYVPTYNPTHSAEILFLGVSSNFGVFYHFRPIKQLILMAGINTQIDFGIKYNSRNVNNIVSVDISAGLYPTGIARYNLNIKQFHFGFQYRVSTPALGCMFVPEMGESYYEVYENLPDLKNNIFVSSFQNKWGISNDFSIHFLMKRATLQAGLKQNYLQWQANNLQFYQKQWGFYIGTVIDLQFRSGKSAEGRNPVWE